MAENAGFVSFVNIYFFPSIEGSKSSKLPYENSDVSASISELANASGDKLATIITTTINKGVVRLFCL